MKKWIARVGVVLGIGLVLLVVMNWSLVNQVATFHPIIFPHFGRAPADGTEARLQDIEYLAKLLDYDRSFDETARSEFEELIANSKQDANTMSPPDLFLLGAKASALADNGHTGMSSWPVRAVFNSVGVRYFHFRDGLYVVRALAEHEQLIGGRVIEIDGNPIDSVLTALRSYTGGADGWRRLYAAMLLESAEIMHAAGLSESPTGYTLTIEDQEGSRLQIDLTAQMPHADGPAPVELPWKTLDPEAWPAEEDEWLRSLQSVSDDVLPLYLQNIDQRFMWEPVEDGGGYLRLQNTLNTNEQSLATFLDESLGALPEGFLRYLVVDLRANDGGDFTLFVEAAQWLPGKVADDGHLYILVGPQTFSSGVIGAAMLKFYGSERASIIGAPMGDREQFWAERGLPFRLPNSGFQVNYATGFHDWANGCTEHPYCYTPAVKHGVAAGSLTPSRILEPDYADYAAGRDIAMEWIFQQELP